MSLRLAFDEDLREMWDRLLASRHISPHYDETDLDEDVATLREMGRL